MKSANRSRRLSIGWNGYGWNTGCDNIIISFFFNQFGLVIEYDKSEIFHFSRSTKNINLPLLDLRLIEGVLLRLKDI